MTSFMKQWLSAVGLIVVAGIGASSVAKPQESPSNTFSPPPPTIEAPKAVTLPTEPQNAPQRVQALPKKVGAPGAPVPQLSRDPQINWGQLNNIQPTQPANYNYQPPLDNSQNCRPLYESYSHYYYCK